MGTYLLRIFLLFLLLFFFFYCIFFQPNQRVLKQCLRIYLAGFSPFFKKRKRGSAGCSFCSGTNHVSFYWDEINRISDSMDATLLYSILFCFYLTFFVLLGYLFDLVDALRSWLQTLCHLVWITQQ